MKKRLVLILSFLLALLVSVGAAIWIIVYQTKSPYPTELSGEFSLELSFDNNLLTAQNGQLKGDLIKKGLATNDTNAVTTLYVKHELGDKTYKYPIHQAATTSLNNTEFEYGVAEGEGATFEFTDTYSLLTAQNTTEVAVKVLLGGNSNVNSDTQKFLRALLKLPTPDAEGADAAPARFNRGGVAFKVTSNYVSAAYINKTATMQAIAYSGSNNYGTIEGALGATASGTIYVKPQTTVTLTTKKVGDSTVGAIESVTENTGVPKNPYIIKSCEIKSSATLCLPWAGTKAVPAAETVQSHESLVANADYPVANLTSGTLNATLCTNHVTIQSNVTMTNLGTLIVGGVVCGGNGGSAAGYSANQYARITLKANAKIINGKSDGSDAADIQCYGYIYEDTTKNGSQIILYGKSSYISPFKVMEHRGGTVFSDMAGGDINNPQLECSPFNRFYMPNSSVEMTFHYNSSLYGYADLYTNKKLIIPAQHNITTIKIFGTSDEHLLEFANSSTYVVTKYNPATEIHDIDVYGSSVLNSLALNVSIPLMGTLNLSTASVYFPLSWHFDVSIFKGNETTATFTSASQKVKLLTGSSVTIGAGVNATLPSMVVYDAFTDTYSTSPGLRYESKPSAKLIVNGSLTVDSFGGPIETQASKTALTVNTATSITSKEVIDGKTYQEITKTLKLPKYVDATKNYTDKGTYYSEKRSNNTYGWYSTIFKISYDANGGSAVSDTSIELDKAGGYTFTETFLSSKVTTREHYTFSHWCTQDNCTNGSTCANKASGKTVYGDTTLYAAWTKNKYKLNYVYVVPDGDGVKELDSGIAPTEFTIDTTAIALNNTPSAPTYTYIDEETGEEKTKNYNFSGWFTAPQDGEKITVIGIDAVEAYRDLAFANGGTYGETTIYAVWTKDIIYTVKFNNSHDASKGGYDITDATTVKLDEEGNGTLTVPDKATDDKTLLTAHNDKTTDKMYFDGWYIDAAKTIKFTSFSQLLDEEYTPEVENYERTLYAKWLEKITVNTVIDSTTAFVGYYMPNTQVTTPAAPEKTGYVFTHWSIPNVGNVLANTAFTLEGVAYGDTVNVTAVFEKLVTVTVNLNGGTASYTTTQYVRAGESYTAPAAPTKTGYKFTGWTVTGGSVSSLTASQSAVISSTPGAQVTLTAQYEQLVKITINLNGGTASYATTQYVDAGAPYTAPAAPTNEHDYGYGWGFTTWTVTGGSVNSLTANQSAVISSTPGAQVTLTANYNPTIKVKTNSASISPIDFKDGDIVEIGTVITFTASTTKDNLTVTINGKGISATNGIYEVTVNVPTTIEVTGSCITADTLITLADGTQKRVDQLRGDELLLVWNLNTGRYDVAPIVFVDSENETEYEIIHLYFSDGSDVKVIYEHGFFDLNLRKYVYIDAYNYAQFIGHEFVTQGDISSNTWKKATLTNVVIETERTTAYSPVTFEHLCYYTNGVLSMPGGISGLFNIFDVNTETMSYDEEQMQKDIETYGLFSYDDFKDLIPETAFDAFNGKWLKVAIGKGMLTWEDIEYLAARYVPLM